MFEWVLNIFRKKRHGFSAASHEDAATKRRENYSRFSSELMHLKNSIKRKNAKEKARQFFSLVRSACEQALSLKYQATFQEIQNEIRKSRHIAPDLRDEMDKFLEDISLLDYDWEDYHDILGKKKQEQQLRDSIAKLQKSENNIGDSLKKKISKIIQKSKPLSDREFLVRMVERFEGYLHHLF